MKVSNSGAVPSLTVGGRVFTDLANLITLECFHTSGGSANSTFRVPGGAAGYQVPAGKTLRLWAASMMCNAASSGSPALLYSDNDVGQQTATAYTNPSYKAGADAVPFLYSEGALTSPVERGMNWTIPTGKYVGMKVTGNTNTIQMTVYGYLE